MCQTKELLDNLILYILRRLNQEIIIPINYEVYTSIILCIKIRKVNSRLQKHSIERSREVLPVTNNLRL